jgi:hypothetical protein
MTERELGFMACALLGVIMAVTSQIEVIVMHRKLQKEKNKGHKIA